MAESAYNIWNIKNHRNSMTDHNILKLLIYMYY